MPTDNFIKSTPLPINEVTKNKEIHNLFSNGFQCGFSLSEGHIIFKQNETPIAVVNMGLPAIKSLKNQLAALIDLYEKNTNQKVHSIEELLQNLNKPTPNAKP